MTHHSTTYFIVFSIIATMSIVLGCNCSRQKDMKANPNNMNDLIQRLEKAYVPPVKLGGEAILYQPKEDKTVRNEILAKGKEAVPYLVKGLNHKKEAIREECIALLGRIVCVASLDGLIQYLKTIPPPTKITDIYPDLLQTSLHRLTGYNSASPPVNNKQYDIDGMRKIWLPWWEANKDKLVDIDTGIGLKNDDGSITPLPMKKK